MAIIDPKTSIDPPFMTARASGFVGPTPATTMGRIGVKLFVRSMRIHWASWQPAAFLDFNSSPVDGTTDDLIRITGFKLEE
jgi:hypothetical protein